MPAGGVEECAGPCASGQLLAAHGVGCHHHHQGRLGLAGVMHALLVLQHLRQGRLGLLEIGRDAELEAGLAHDVRQEGGQRGDVAAVAVDDQHALEAVPFHASEQAQQHRSIGRDVERERAAEGHVVLGHAAPQRRRDHHGGIGGDGFRGRLAHGLAQDSVDTDRQMRPVLLHGGHRQHDDGTGLRFRPQVGRGEELPHHGLRHQYVTLRSM